MSVAPPTNVIHNQTLAEPRLYLADCLLFEVQYRSGFNKNEVLEIIIIKLILCGNE